MPRPCKRRLVSLGCEIREFRRAEIAAGAPRLTLPLDGLEALRLVDLERLDQVRAAARMGVSRQTFGRILAVARHVVTRALIEDIALRVEDSSRRTVPTAATTPRVHATAPHWIAVSVRGDTLEAPVDPHFGRASGFLLVAADGGTTRYLANPGADGRASGAGAAAAAAIAEANVRLLLTGEIGPNARRALAALGIAVVEGLADLTAGEAITRWQRGELTLSALDVLQPSLGEDPARPDAGKPEKSC